MTNFTDLARNASGSAPLGQSAADKAVAARFPDGPAGTLDRLATVLGVPPRSFFQDGQPGLAPGAVDPSETLDLVRLFLDVKDPASRAECLAFVRARAGRR
jgi:hypothetical protein